MKRRPGAAGEAVRAIGGTPDGIPSAPGRAGRVLPALAGFIRTLLAEKRAALATPSRTGARWARGTFEPRVVANAGQSPAPLS